MAMGVLNGVPSKNFSVFCRTCSIPCQANLMLHFTFEGFLTSSLLSWGSNTTIVDCAVWSVKLPSRYIFSQMNVEYWMFMPCHLHPSLWPGKLAFPCWGPLWIMLCQHLPKGNHEKPTRFVYLRLFIGSDLLLFWISTCQQFSIWTKQIQDQSCLTIGNWCTYAYPGLMLMSWGIHLLNHDMYGKKRWLLRKQE